MKAPFTNRKALMQLDQLRDIHTIAIERGDRLSKQNKAIQYANENLRKELKELKETATAIETQRNTLRDQVRKQAVADEVFASLRILAKHLAINSDLALGSPPLDRLRSQQLEAQKRYALAQQSATRRDVFCNPDYLKALGL